MNLLDGDHPVGADTDSFEELVARDVSNLEIEGKRRFEFGGSALGDGSAEPFGDQHRQLAFDVGIDVVASISQGCKSIGVTGQTVPSGDYAVNHDAVARFGGEGSADQALVLLCRLESCARYGKGKMSFGKWLAVENPTRTITSPVILARPAKRTGEENATRQERDDRSREQEPYGGSPLVVVVGDDDDSNPRSNDG